jgi:cell division protein FtsB
MPTRILLPLAFSTVLAAGLSATVLAAQGQDSQSVAEAARRAREQKKNAAKPTKVITDETLDVKKGDIQSAVAEEPRMPGTPDAKDQSATPSANAAANPSGAAQGPADEKRKKEVAALKEQIKQAQSDLDLLKRDQALQQDTYYSNPDFSHDTAGKAKLDAMKQQVSDKQEELDKLKARLADLGGTLDNPPATPPKP